MTIFQTSQAFSGEANIWFNTQMKTYFVILGNSRDKIPVGVHALIKITYDKIENPIIFQAKIIKAIVLETHNYLIKLICIPLRHAHLISRDLKRINYHIQILSEA